MFVCFCFRGNEGRKCAFDQAFDIWKQFVPEDRIILRAKKDSRNGRSKGPYGLLWNSHIGYSTDARRAAVSGCSLINRSPISCWDLDYVFMSSTVKQMVPWKLPAQHVPDGLTFVYGSSKCDFKLRYRCFLHTINRVEEITGLKYTTNDIVILKSRLKVKNGIKSSYTMWLSITLRAVALLLPMVNYRLIQARVMWFVVFCVVPSVTDSRRSKKVLYLQIGSCFSWSNEFEFFSQKSNPGKI
jgi:hypothetical protein